MKQVKWHKPVYEAINELAECYRELSEWIQLATYQRQQSEKPNHDPLCASIAGIQKSKSRMKSIGRTETKLRRILAEAGAGE